MIDPQSIANDIRDQVVDHPVIRLLGIEVLWATGTAQRLTLRVRHRDQVLDVERADAWTRRIPAELAGEMAHEMVGEALGTRRPAVPSRRSIPGPIAPLELREPRRPRGLGRQGQRS